MSQGDLPCAGPHEDGHGQLHPAADPPVHSEAVCRVRGQQVQTVPADPGRLVDAHTVTPVRT